MNRRLLTESELVEIAKENGEIFYFYSDYDRQEEEGVAKVSLHENMNGEGYYVEIHNQYGDHFDLCGEPNEPCIVDCECTLSLHPADTDDRTLIVIDQNCKVEMLTRQEIRKQWGDNLNQIIIISGEVVDKEELLK